MKIVKHIYCIEHTNIAKFGRKLCDLVNRSQANGDEVEIQYSATSKSYSALVVVKKEQFINVGVLQNESE